MLISTYYQTHLYSYISLKNSTLSRGAVVTSQRIIADHELGGSLIHLTRFLGAVLLTSGSSERVDGGAPRMFQVGHRACALSANTRQGTTLTCSGERGHGAEHIAVGMVAEAQWQAQQFGPTWETHATTLTLPPASYLAASFANI